MEIGKTFREGIPTGQDEITLIIDENVEEKNFPDIIDCFRCRVIMNRIAIKRAGARYECPLCGRLINMEPSGRLTIIRAGKRRGTC